MYQTYPETPHETQSYLHYQTKIQIWEWGRERDREERDWWNPIYKPMLHNPPLLDVALSTCASLFYSLFVFAVCVYLLSFCVSAFFFLFFFFFCTCPLQFIEELRSSFPLLLLLPDQFMEQSKSVFLPQFLTSWSATPHYFHFSSSWQVTPLLLRCGAL